jgi:hypothetical protein
MGARIMAIPPPPPGFVLDEEEDIPPPPAGFIVNSVQKASPQKDPSLLTRSLATLKEGFGDAGTSLVSGGRDPAGNVQKAIFGDAVPALGSVIGDTISEITPDIVKEGLSDTLEWMKENKKTHPLYGDSSIIEGGAQIAEAIGPEMRERLGEIVNMAPGLPKAAGGYNSISKPFRAKFGDKSALKLARDDVERRARGTKKILDPDVIDPINTEVSPSLKNYESIPADWDKRMIARVNDIEEFNPNGNMVENIKAIDKTNKSLAAKLDSDLIDADSIPAVDIEKLLQKQVEEAGKNFVLTGDAGKAAERIYKMMDDIVQDYIVDGQISAVDLLNARRKFDAKIKSMSKGIFDPTTTTANKIATGGIRTAVNERVAQAAPKIDVLDSLSHQADLYKANETLIPRAQKQSKYGLGRAVDKVEGDTGLAPARTPLAATANVTSPLASAVAITGTGISLAGRKVLEGLRASRTAGARGGQGLTNAALSTLPAAERAAILAALQQDEEE